MKKFYLVSFYVLIAGLSTAQDVWINEFHYDNSGSDTNESVEIAGKAGIEINDYSIVFYNGSNGEPYKSYSIPDRMIPNESNGYGSVCFLVSGIQNGSPDGIALVDNSGAVLQFISYEGQFTALSGPASGMESIIIGIEESPDTETGYSLQLFGDGKIYSDFEWRISNSSCGSVNNEQSFSLEEEETVEIACSPVSIVSFNQGRKKNGRRISRFRSNPDRALGPPQENDTFNFVSLGFGGSIVFELSEPVVDDGTYKPDIVLVETTFGRADEMCFQENKKHYPESVFILVSEDGEKWYSIPDSFCRTSFIDLSQPFKQGLREVNFIKITDASNRVWFRGNADGFDIDGIIVCQAEVDNALNRLQNNRIKNKGLFDPEFVNQAPDEEGDFEFELYPNPLLGNKLNIAFNLESDMHPTATIQIMDLQGRVIYEERVSTSIGTNTINLELNIPIGQYLVKLDIGTFSDSRMLIIR